MTMAIGMVPLECRQRVEICPPVRARIFGIAVDPLRMNGAVARVLDWSRMRDGRCRFVVTPNTDHAVLLHEHAGLRNAYDQADLILVDGMPLLMAAKILRRGIPERVPGSDLVPAIFDSVANSAERRPLKIYLLGAGPGIAELAATRIHSKWPGVQVVGCYSPMPGFENRPAENDAILDRISATHCDLLIVGLGAPKQELWVAAHRDRIDAAVALCVGATIDFLAGEKARAPVWMRRTGLEWLHRLASEPRRLAKRYLRDAIQLPRLFARELFARIQPDATPPDGQPEC